ncbi:hypothetical protein J3A64_003833 [Pseudarthrobacter sp. PvP004]|nr:hypothetical protein [Pseudarthrobacter sp. PvP004]
MQSPNNNPIPDHNGELGSTEVLTELGLPARPMTSLRRRGISTIEELITWSAEDLRFEVQGLGRGGLKEIEAALARLGLQLSATTRRSEVAAAATTGKLATANAARAEGRTAMEAARLVGWSRATLYRHHQAASRRSVDI